MIANIFLLSMVRPLVHQDSMQPVLLIIWYSIEAFGKFNRKEMMDNFYIKDSHYSKKL